MDIHVLRKCPDDRLHNGKIIERRRSGLASIEVVLATATSFVTATLLAGAGVRACLNLYHTIANLVGWPYL